jgi:hypothetical protein
MIAAALAGPFGIAWISSMRVFGAESCSAPVPPTCFSIAISTPFAGSGRFFSSSISAGSLGERGRIGSAVGDRLFEALGQLLDTRRGLFDGLGETVAFAGERGHGILAHVAAIGAERAGVIVDRLDPVLVGLAVASAGLFHEVGVGLDQVDDRAGRGERESSPSTISTMPGQPRSSTPSSRRSLRSPA